MSLNGSIQEFQSDVEKALEAIRAFHEIGALPEALKPLVHLAPPEGIKVEVSIFRKDGRKIRRDAGAEKNWSPQDCRAEIVYVGSEDEEAEYEDWYPEESSMDSEPATGNVAAPRNNFRDSLSDLVFALDRVEGNPRFRFVSLKWFRDTYLPRMGFEWCDTLEDRQGAIEQAVSNRLVLTGKIPNPKNPAFPTTTIRLNRRSREVREIISDLAGSEESNQAPFFQESDMTSSFYGERRY